METKGIILTLLFVTFWRPSDSADYCFSCNSTSDPACSESWDPSNVNEARYTTECKNSFCIKEVGVKEKVTKRYCSSQDLGNYCDDKSCVSTCRTQICNGASESRNIGAFFVGFMLFISAILK